MTKVGNREIEEEVKTTKEVKNNYKERDNNKTELFGSGESGKIRMLGNWMG